MPTGSFGRPGGGQHLSSALLFPSGVMVTFLRFRMGCPNLLVVVGHRGPVRIPRAQRPCPFCSAPFESHIVFECRGLPPLRAQFPHLFRTQQAVQSFMWQAGFGGVAQVPRAFILKLVAESSLIRQTGCAGVPLSSFTLVSVCDVASTASECRTAVCQLCAIRHSVCAETCLSRAFSCSCFRIRERMLALTIVMDTMKESASHVPARSARMAPLWRYPSECGCH